MPDNTLFLQGIALVTPQTTLENQCLLIDQGHVAGYGPEGEFLPPAHAQVFDAQGLVCAPGLIDIQVNGGFGCDFTGDTATIYKVGAQLPQFGVTSFLPTIVSSPLETVARAQQVVMEGPPAGYKGARVVGLHVEGPFLNPERKGAHHEVYLCPPDLDMCQDFSPQTSVCLLTLAPELPGADDVIDLLVGRGVQVSAGHSMASYRQAQAAFDRGVCMGTHIFNAMPPLNQFEPGLVGALLESDSASVGLICDGIHVHPMLVRLIWQMKGPEGLILVTDAMAALGMGPGTYMLGDRAVQVDHESARLENGILAGSVLSLDAAVRNLIAFTGCDVQQAVMCASGNPARLLGINSGTIENGASADLVLLTPDLQVAATLIEGQVVYTDEQRSNWLAAG